MDLCHCITPETARASRQDGTPGDLFCRRCGLWFDQKQWEEDSRVRAARKLEARRNPPANTIRVPFAAAVDVYQPCPCRSGKKFKFCCLKKLPK